MTATSSSADAFVDPVRVIDAREARPDVGACLLGLPHRVGDAGCKAFRRAIRAKGLNPPPGGWACHADPASRLGAELPSGRG